MPKEPWETQTKEREAHNECVERLLPKTLLQNLRPLSSTMAAFRFWELVGNSFDNCLLLHIALLLLRITKIVTPKMFHRKYAGRERDKHEISHIFAKIRNEIVITKANYIFDVLQCSCAAVGTVVAGAAPVTRESNLDFRVCFVQCSGATCILLREQ